MTVKLIALYRKPDDVEAFMHHYEEVHSPLIRQVPGLEQLIVNRVTGAPVGEAPYFLIAEMLFADREAFDQAMRSPENRASGKDLTSSARYLVTLVIAEAQSPSWEATPSTGSAPLSPTAPSFMTPRS